MDYLRALLHPCNNSCHKACMQTSIDFTNWSLNTLRAMQWGHLSSFFFTFEIFSDVDIIAFSLQNVTDFINWSLDTVQMLTLFT